MSFTDGSWSFYCRIPDAFFFHLVLFSYSRYRLKCFLLCMKLYHSRQEAINKRYTSSETGVKQEPFLSEKCTFLFLLFIHGGTVYRMLLLQFYEYVWLPAAENTFMCTAWNLNHCWNSVKWEETGKTKRDFFVRTTSEQVNWKLPDNVTFSSAIQYIKLLT